MENAKSCKLSSFRVSIVGHKVFVARVRCTVKHMLLDGAQIDDVWLTKGRNSMLVKRVVFCVSCMTCTTVNTALQVASNWLRPHIESLETCRNEKSYVKNRPLSM